MPALLSTFNFLFSCSLASKNFNHCPSVQDEESCPASSDQMAPTFIAFVVLHSVQLSRVVLNDTENDEILLIIL
jgi:hypothetical protein